MVTFKYISDAEVEAIHEATANALGESINI